MSETCSDCPPKDYPTDATRCAECPLRKPPTSGPEVAVGQSLEEFCDLYQEFS